MFWRKRKNKAVELDAQADQVHPQTEHDEASNAEPPRTTGVPYVPEEHKGFDLLPRCRKHSEEVFCYPVELNLLNETVSRLEEDPEGVVEDRLGPGDSKTLEEFCARIRERAQLYRAKNRDLYEDLMALVGIVKRMNVKEEWSVVRYVGSHFDDDPLADLFDLTKGRCYYWPCSSTTPAYQGVFDNEETVPYLYPCDSDSWEIVLDPTGMAAAAIKDGASPVAAWTDSGAEDGQRSKSSLVGHISSKRTRRPYAYNRADEERWPATVVDRIELPCASCGYPMDVELRLLVNARDSMEYAKELANGKGYSFLCPECYHRSTFLYPTLFLDPEHSLLAFLALDTEDVSDFEAALESYEIDDGWDGPQGRRKRIAKSHEEFQGIVAASIAGLDDRALQILLVQVLREAKECGDLPIGNTFYWFFYNVDADSDIVFKALDEGNAYLIKASMDGYESIVEALNKSSVKDSQSYCVDKEWAYEAIDKLLDEDLLSHEDF